AGERRLRVFVEDRRENAQAQQSAVVEVRAPVELDVDALRKHASLIDERGVEVTRGAEVALRQRRAADILAIDQVAELIAGRKLRARVRARCRGEQRVVLRVHALLVNDREARNADGLLELDLVPVQRQRPLIEAE